MEAVTHPEGETEASHPQLDSEAPTVGCSHAPCAVLCAHASTKKHACQLSHLLTQLSLSSHQPYCQGRCPEQKRSGEWQAVVRWAA